MKVAVYGAGAVGSFYGGLLVRAGLDVHFITRGAQLEALRTRGLRIESTLLGSLLIHPVSATDQGSTIGPVEIVLICVKAHQTSEILDQLPPLVGDSTIIVPMQNGIESDEVLASRFGRERVCAAVVYVGATAIAPGITAHVANGSIVLGAPTGFDAARLPAVRAALSPGFPVKISGDIERDRWYKLVWNASINPLTAITQRTPYELVMQPDTRAQLLEIMREVMAVGRAHGIELTEQAAHDYFKWIEKTPEIRTSMQFHRERGLSLETDALVGVVVRKGRERGVPTPLSEALVATLNGLEGV
jgi:2-dehydropantoate 2-reductase